MGTEANSLPARCRSRRLFFTESNYKIWLLAFHVIIVTCFYDIQTAVAGCWMLTPMKHKSCHTDDDDNNDNVRMCASTFKRPRISCQPSLLYAAKFSPKYACFFFFLLKCQTLITTTVNMLGDGVAEIGSISKSQQHSLSVPTLGTRFFGFWVMVPFLQFTNVSTM